MSLITKIIIVIMIIITFFLLLTQTEAMKDFFNSFMEIAKAIINPIKDVLGSLF